MISMLRHIYDLKLSTPVMLLYCVRPAADITSKTNWPDLEYLYPTSITRCACHNQMQPGRVTAAVLQGSLSPRVPD
jgi:hypothetical protein